MLELRGAGSDGLPAQTLPLGGDSPTWMGGGAGGSARPSGWTRRATAMSGGGEDVGGTASGDGTGVVARRMCANCARKRPMVAQREGGIDHTLLYQYL